MRDWLIIDPRTYILWAVLILIVPIPWVAAAVLSAGVHELCHMGMLLFFRIPVQQLKVRPGGAEICANITDLWQELLCILAGPVGSFSLVLVCYWLPRTAICGVLQGIFNLLPIYPLDGGRALRCILTLLETKKPCKAA